jgi:phosphatidate cytidylyltransferase
MTFPPDLFKRIASALILAPLVLYVVWLGGWPFWGLVLIAFSLAVYEGLSLAMRTKWVLLAAPLVVMYLAIAVTSFVLLRELGPLPVFALLLAVWATDIGAYGAGRLIGGAKLAPAISPNKTWAGLLGGIAASVAVFILFALTTPASENMINLVIIGAVIAVVGQMGDLIESFLKRQAGAKDSGAIIPGHGGLLDRIDGLLLAAPVFLLLLKGMAG